MLKNALPYDGEGVCADDKSSDGRTRGRSAGARKPPRTPSIPVWGSRAEKTSCTIHFLSRADAMERADILIGIQFDVKENKREEWGS